MPEVAAFVAKVTEVLINPILALIFTAALFLFLWGVFQMIAHGDSDEARSTGKQHMLWGLVGMTIMVSVFAILKVGLATFGITQTSGDIPVELPLFK